MFRTFSKCAYVVVMALCLGPVHSFATEVLRPVLPPQSRAALQTAFELDEDVYSLDLQAYAEFAPQLWLSIYGEGAFRFFSLSYEYELAGYLHNWANLHVNGFNETYLGAKIKPFKNVGLDVNWQFPPGEGSQKHRFHRLNVEPFAVYHFSKHLVLGASVRYNKFFEDAGYKPGCEFGLKSSFVWNVFWNDTARTGWELSEAFLYQARLQNSKNMNLDRHYRNMQDKYRGMKLAFGATRYFAFWSVLMGFGLDYEMHRGSLFGFEDGHRVGLHIISPI